MEKMLLLHPASDKIGTSLGQLHRPMQLREVGRI